MAFLTRVQRVSIKEPVSQHQHSQLSDFSRETQLVPGVKVQKCQNQQRRVGVDICPGCWRDTDKFQSPGARLSKSCSRLESLHSTTKLTPAHSRILTWTAVHTWIVMGLLSGQHRPSPVHVHRRRPENELSE